MNFWDIILIIVLAGLVALALWLMVRNRRRGGPCSACMGDCSACKGAAVCKAREETAKTKEKVSVDNK